MKNSKNASSRNRSCVYSQSDLKVNPKLPPDTSNVHFDKRDFNREISGKGETQPRRARSRHRRSKKKSKSNLIKFTAEEPTTSTLSTFAINSKLNKYSDSNYSLAAQPSKHDLKCCCCPKCLKDNSLRVNIYENVKKPPRVSSRCRSSCSSHSNISRELSDSIKDLLQDFENAQNQSQELYRSFLGPSADETILAGLQTFIDLCQDFTGRTHLKIPADIDACSLFSCNRKYPPSTCSSTENTYVQEHYPCICDSESEQSIQKVYDNGRRYQRDDDADSLLPRKASSSNYNIPKKHKSHRKKSPKPICKSKETLTEPETKKPKSKRKEERQNSSLRSLTPSSGIDVSKIYLPESKSKEKSLSRHRVKSKKRQEDEEPKRSSGKKKRDSALGSNTRNVYVGAAMVDDPLLDGGVNVVRNSNRRKSDQYNQMEHDILSPRLPEDYQISSRISKHSSSHYKNVERRTLDPRDRKSGSEYRKSTRYGNVEERIMSPRMSREYVDEDHEILPPERDSPSFDKRYSSTHGRNSHRESAQEKYLSLDEPPPCSPSCETMDDGRTKSLQSLEELVKSAVSSRSSRKHLGTSESSSSGTRESLEQFINSIVMNKRDIESVEKALEAALTRSREDSPIDPEDIEDFLHTLEEAKIASGLYTTRSSGSTSTAASRSSSTKPRSTTTTTGVSSSSHIITLDNAGSKSVTKKTSFAKKSSSKRISKIDSSLREIPEKDSSILSKPSVEGSLDQDPSMLRQSSLLMKPASAFKESLEDVEEEEIPPKSKTESESFKKDSSRIVKRDSEGPLDEKESQMDPDASISKRSTSSMRKPSKSTRSVKKTTSQSVPKVASGVTTFSEEENFSERKELTDKGTIVSRDLETVSKKSVAEKGTSVSRNLETYSKKSIHEKGTSTSRNLDGISRKSMTTSTTGHCFYKGTSVCQDTQSGKLAKGQIPCSCVGTNVTQDSFEAEMESALCTCSLSSISGEESSEGEDGDVVEIVEEEETEEYEAVIEIIEEEDEEEEEEVTETSLTRTPTPKDESVEMIKPKTIKETTDKAPKDIPTREPRSPKIMDNAICKISDFGACAVYEIMKVSSFEEGSKIPFKPDRAFVRRNKK